MFRIDFTAVKTTLIVHMSHGIFCGGSPSFIYFLIFFTAFGYMSRKLFTKFTYDTLTAYN